MSDAGTREVAPDYVEDDRDVGKAVQLLVPYDSESGNTLRLLNRLDSVGYEVTKQTTTEYQTVYNVFPQPERTEPETDFLSRVQTEED